jgi:glycine cleavage system aminomethyltransferase T
MSENDTLAVFPQGQNIGAVPAYPDIPTYKMVFGNLHVWEGDGWKDESMSWKTGCYVAANLTGPGMQVTYSGPDAQAALSRFSINNVNNWRIGTSKHLVMPDADGLIANHGLAIRDGEDTFRQLASIPWAAYQLEHLDMDVQVSYQDIFILQVAGPTSIQVLERVLGESLRDVRFLAIRKIQIAGLEAELEVSRIGMVGTLAYEIRGPFEAGPAVYDAVYQAGKDLGIKRLGWRTYLVNHTEGGFPQLNCTFLPSVFADEAFMATPLSAFLGRNISGSIDPTDLRARFRTPQEVNWAWMAKFDHDFLGREAVEAEAAAPRRKTVILRWNHDDILSILASQFEPGEEYKYIEFPCAPQQLAGGHADLVTKNAKPVGVSSAAVYSYYYREMLSQCAIDLDQAEIGNKVVLHWGDYGKRIKEVRATVERFPYLDLPSNRDYDLSSVPSGLVTA